MSITDGIYLLAATAIVCSIGSVAFVMWLAKQGSGCKKHRA